MFPILGDGRCFWRSVVQWLDDLTRAKSYNESGELEDPEVATRETAEADKLKHNVLDFAQRTGINEYAEPSPKKWINMRKARSWADEVCIAACAAYLRRCIVVPAFYPDLGQIYVHKYCDNCESVQNKCIPVFYNGVDHYELVCEVWLQDPDFLKIITF